MSTTPETPPATPGEALFRFETRHRPHVWPQWADTDDGFRTQFELEAAKIIAVAPKASGIVVVDR